MTKPTDLNILDPKEVMVVNRSPLQRPGLDTLIRTATTGGPELGGDRRVYLSSQLLGQLLEVARSSSMGRVQVNQAGVRVDLYERPDGHRYEVWTLIGATPEPEPMPSALRALGAG